MLLLFCLSHYKPQTIDYHIHLEPVHIEKGHGSKPASQTKKKTKCEDSKVLTFYPCFFGSDLSQAKTKQ